MAPNVLTVAAQITVDGTVEGRAQAHTLLNLLFDAVAVGATEAVGDPTPSEPGVAAKDGLIKLTPEKLSDVLTALSTGANGAPLNSGERQMLQGIAERAPAPLTYDDNRKLLGSGAKFGNVSSGLSRRFFSRGYERPYEEAKDGYFMELPIAAVVREVLGATGA
jgi:hypothetical protein